MNCFFIFFNKIIKRSPLTRVCLKEFLKKKKTYINSFKEKFETKTNFYSYLSADFDISQDNETVFAIPFFDLKRVHIHSVISGKTLFSLTKFSFPVSVIKLFEKFGLLFIAEINGTVHIFDLEKKIEIQCFKQLELNCVFSVAYLDNIVFIGGDNGKIILIDIQTQTVIKVLTGDIPKHIYSLQSFSNKTDKKVYIVGTGNVIHPLRIFVFVLSDLFL